MEGSVDEIPGSARIRAWERSYPYKTIQSNTPHLYLQEVEEIRLSSNRSSSW